MTEKRSLRPTLFRVFLVLVVSVSIVHGLSTKSTISADSSGSVDLTEAFKSSAISTKDGTLTDTSLVSNISGGTIELGKSRYGTGWWHEEWQTVAFTSNYSIDFGQSFKIEATYKNPDGAPDGFAVAFQTNPDYTVADSNISGGSLGVYGYDKDANESAKPGVANGLVFEIDSYNNVDWADHTVKWADKADQPKNTSHIGINTTDEVGRNVTSQRFAPVSTVTGDASKKVTIEWNKDTSTATFTYDTTVITYEGFNPTALFGNQDVYMVIAGVSGMDTSSNPTLSGHTFTVNSFSYTEIEPSATTGHYVIRNGAQVNYDEANIVTWPKAGERLYIDNSIVNLNSSITETKTGQVRVKELTIGTQQVNPTVIGINGKETAMTEENQIFNDAKYLGLYNELDFPYLANSQVSHLTYSIVIPSDVTADTTVNNTLTLGSDFMTQYDISSTVRIAANPTLSSVSDSIALVHQNSTVDLNSLYQGKLFDETALGHVLGANREMVIASGDASTAVLGTKTLEYQLQDLRTGLVSNTVSRTINVVPDSTLVSDDLRYGVSASDVVITQNTAKVLSTTALLSSVNEAKGYNGTDSLAVNVAIDSSSWAQMQEGVLGTYYVNYSIGNAGESNYVNKQVSIVVVGNDQIISEDKSNSLYAEDASLSIADANALNSKEELMELTNALVTVADGTTVYPELSDVDFLKVNEAVTEKDVVITYTYGSGTSAVSKQVTVSLINDDSVKSENGKNVIKASAAAISSDDIKSMLENGLDRDLIDTHSASLTLDGVLSNSSLEIVIPEYEALKAGKVGQYNISFVYTDPADIRGNVTRTVILTVKNKVTVNTTTGETISANDFVISKDQVTGISNSTLISLANANATLTADGSPVTITNVNKGTLSAARGVYSVTFATAKGTSVTVNVTVKDSAVVDVTNQEVISANDFSISKNETSTISNQTLIELADASASSVIDGSEVQVTSVNRLNLKNELGSYSISFSTLKGTTVTVRVTVRSNAVINSENQERISANDFVISVNQAATVSDQTLIELANATAASTVDGTAVAITSIDKTDLTGKMGIYPVTFSTAKGTSITVNVTVKNSVVVNPNTSETISANHFSLAKEKVASLTDQEAISLANAQAFDSSTGAAVAITTVDKTQVMSQTGKYTITFKTSKGTSVSVQVSVSDNVIVDSENNEQISGNNFTIGKDSVNALSDAQIIAYANAKASDVSTGAEVAITSVDKSQLQAVKGSYAVKLSTAKGTSINVTVTVTDGGTISTENGEMITANNFFMSVDEVSEVTNAGLIQLANAKATSLSDGSDVQITSVDYSSLKAEVGSYSITFVTAKGTSVTVLAVVRSGSVTDSVNQEKISASDFTLTVNQVATVSDETLIEASQAMAISTVDNSPVDITSVDRSLLEGKVGIYPVTFKTAKGTAITVYATVKNNSVINPSNEEQISANHFTLNRAEVSSITDEQLIAKAQATAINTTDGSAVSVKIADKTQLKAEVGSYVISFSTEKGTTVSTIVRVVDETVSDSSNQETIGANNFTIGLSEVGQITDAQYIERANAKASSTADGSEVAITTVDASDIKASVGTYSITFKTAKGTSITVSVTVSDYVVVDPVTGEQISANDFRIGKDAVNGLTDKQVIELSNAKAISSSTGQEVEITDVNKDALKAEKGNYSVTLATAAGTSATIVVTVTDAGTVDPVNEEVISANSFVMEVSEVADVSDAILIERADAKAYRLADGSEVAISSVDKSELKAHAGAYDITFATAKGTSVVVKAVVRSSIVVDQVNQESISANDFVLTVNQVATVSDQTLIELAQASAVSIADSSPVAITTVDRSNLEAKLGVYSITFMTAKGTSVTVNATVKNSSVISPVNGEQISANNFTVSKSEVDSLSDELLIARANASAINTEDGNQITVNVADRSQLKAEIGTYIIRFATEKGTSVSVAVSVVDHIVVNPSTSEQISANDFSMSIEEVGILSDEDLIDRADVKVIDETDGSAVSITIVDSSQINASVGTYDVTFATAKGTSITVKASVKSNSIINSENGEQISANNFSLGVNEADMVSDEEIIALANASAINIIDGSAVVIAVDRTALKSVAGSYNVMFTTAKGTSITVIATVKDNVVINPVNGESISANNFTLNVDAVRSVTDQLLIGLANAEAANLSDGSSVEITKVDKQLLMAAVGKYEVTFATEKGTSITVIATVTNQGTIDYENGEILTANDFVIAKDDVASLTSDTLIGLANAKASSITDGSSIAITSVDATQVIAVRGEYPVTFMTAKGTSVTVYAKVTDKAITDPQTKESMHGNNIVLDQQQVSSITDQSLIELGNVKAYDEAGQAVKVIVSDRTSLQAAIGTYPVVFATEKGTQITLDVIVKSNVVVDPDTNIQMSSNDILLGTGEVNYISNEELIHRGNVEAIDLNTGSMITDIDVNRGDLVNLKGKYQIEFSVSTVGLLRTLNTVTMTSDVQVKDVVVTDYENDIQIGANHFVLSASQVNDLTDEKMIALALASANMLSDYQEVAISSVDYSTIAAQQGQYTVSFTANGVVATVDVLVKSNAITSEDGSEQISANNFAIAQDKVEGISDEQLVSLANASAVDLTTGQNLNVIVSNRSLLKAENGIYPITFSTKSGTAVTVLVTVQTHIYHDENTGESMSVNDITLNVSDVKAGNIDYVSTANAQAWVTETGVPVSVSANAELVKAAAGTYEVTYSTAKGTSIIGYVRVVADDSGENTDEPVLKLPDTGVQNTVSMVAATLLVVGGALVIARRKREEE